MSPLLLSFQGSWEAALPHPPRYLSTGSPELSCCDNQLSICKLGDAGTACRICTREDGNLWIIGKGGFGEVYKGIRAGDLWAAYATCLVL